MQQDEEWKDIPINGLEKYQVSNHGNIREWCKNNNSYKTKKKVFSQKGYFLINVALPNNKYRVMFLHRLIAITFITVPNNLIPIINQKFIDKVPFIVNHINGNKTDNRIENLEWCDHKLNINHAINTGLCKHFYQIEVMDIQTKTIKLFMSAKSLADFLNTHHSNIAYIVTTHTVLPYKERYIFNVITNIINKEMNIGNHLRKEVICKDFISGKILIYKSVFNASAATGVKYKMIINRCKSNYNLPNRHDLAGYDFIYLMNIDLNNPPKWADINYDIAIHNRHNYFVNIHK